MLDGQAPAGLLKRLGVTNGAVYFATYEFKNEKRALKELRQVYEELAE